MEMQFPLRALVRFYLWTEVFEFYIFICHKISSCALFFNHEKVQTLRLVAESHLGHSLLTVV